VRTTVTLEPDVAAKIKELAHQQRTSFKRALNQALRRGLAAMRAGDAVAPPPFSVEPHDGGFLPGIDPGKLGQLLDQLDVEDFGAESGTRR
jgi:hypothetical protein